MRNTIAHSCLLWNSRCVDPLILADDNENIYRANKKKIN